MLDHDIDTAPALALLTSRDNDPLSLSRRRFLQLVGLGVGAGLTGGSLLEALGGRETWAAPPVGSNEGILLIVGMYGGNDGFNTLVPYADPTYYALRPKIGIARDQVVQLSDRAGLHPSLAPLLPLWKERRLAVLRGVGYPEPNLSHFRSIEIWDTASSSGEYLQEGWLTRAFAAAPPPRRYRGVPPADGPAPRSSWRRPASRRRRRRPGGENSPRRP